MFVLYFSYHYSYSTFVIVRKRDRVAAGQDEGVPAARLAVDVGPEGHFRGPAPWSKEDRRGDQHRRDVHHHRGLRLRCRQLQGQRYRPYPNQVNNDTGR